MAPHEAKNMQRHANIKHKQANILFLHRKYFF